MIVVLWGVSGCGKTTMGKMLADQLEGVFFDADDYHPPANVEKLRAGVALQDSDRWPWLAAVTKVVSEAHDQAKAVVLACSALKQSYRENLKIDNADMRFVQLSGSFDLIAARMAKRHHEFMNPNLLQSQFETLELASEGIVVNIDQTTAALCRQIIVSLEQR